MRKKILVAVILILGVHFGSCSKEEFTQSKPNILIILADDLGYADVGYNGSDIRTPNIDRIASEGVRLEQYYSCPVCSPSRAGLMTGRYPLRYGLMRSAISPQAEFGLSIEEETIAEMLSRAGYNFRGMVGKWHLGYRRREWHPYNRGFTYFKGSLNGAVNYFNRNLSIGPQLEGDLDWYVNDQLSHEEGYTTDIIGDAAVEFINSVPMDNPFFLYVPFTAPHGPFQAKPEDLEKYPNRTGTKKIYAGMVDNMDQNIGKILKCLAERGQLNNTFILFASDNGGLLKGASNGELRGGKLTPYQGGIRVVAAVRWPSGGVFGKQIVDQRVGYIDIFPTLMEVADFKGFPRNDLDGKNILPILKGAVIEDREWYSYLDQGGDKIEDLAVNKDQWKLIVKRPAPDMEEEKSTIYQLFRISSDPYEKDNVSRQYPVKVDELYRGIEDFYGLKANKQIPRYFENSNEGKVESPDWKMKK